MIPLSFRFLHSSVKELWKIYNLIYIENCKVITVCLYIPDNIMESVVIYSKNNLDYFFLDGSKVKREWVWTRN